MPHEAIIKFKVINSLSSLSQAPIQKNTLWFVEGNELLFFDTLAGVRVGFSDIVILATDAERLSLQSSQVNIYKFYRVQQTNKIWIYNGKWIDITADGGGSFDIEEHREAIETIIQEYLDGDFMTQLEIKIAQIIENILGGSGGLPGGDGLQTLKILKGIETIRPGVLVKIPIDCGFTAYEIKTIMVENLTNVDKLKIFIFEDNETDDVIYMSLESNVVYNNTAEVTNISDSGYIYLGVINETANAVDDISFRYRLNVVNLKNGGIEE